MAIGLRAGLPAAMLLGLAACTSTDDTSEPASTPAATTSAPAPSSQQTEPSESAPEEEQQPVVPRAQSLQAVMAKDYRPGRFEVIRRVGDYGAYVRSEVRYRSDGVWVSGIMNRPKGRGPFPALVLNHGYIEPSTYVTGQGLAREQDALARAGYVVLHTDYRGHAASGPVTTIERETRLGYTEDVITAVRTTRTLPFVDPERIGLLGRSMGGGITYNALVAKPGLVDAAVVYAPVSSRFVDNLNRWTLTERPDVAEQVFKRLGTPAREPATYRDLSARAFFDRITEPVLIHHGTADESCPLRWSRASFRALQASDVQSRLVVYPGEPHAFIRDWRRSMNITIRFFDRNL